MKQIYTTLIALLVATSLMAGKITATSSGFANQPGIWELGRVPGEGDSIIIPAHITVTLNRSSDLDNVITAIDFNSDVKDNVSIQLINMGEQVIVRKQFRLLTGLS